MVPTQPERARGRGWPKGWPPRLRRDEPGCPQVCAGAVSPGGGCRTGELSLAGFMPLRLRGAGTSIAVRVAPLPAAAGQERLLARGRRRSVRMERAVRARQGQWVAAGLAAASAALIVAGLAVGFADRHLAPARLTGWDFPDVSGAVVYLAVPVVGFVLASRRPGSRIGWLFLAAGLAKGLSSFSRPYAAHALVVAPGSWPAGQALAWLSDWVEWPGIPAVAFAILLFPTGRLRSRRWLPVAWFVAAASGLVAAYAAALAGRHWSRPLSPSASVDTAAFTPLAIVVTVLVVAAVLVSVTAVVARFGGSAGEERLQLKWFTTAAVFVVATFILSNVTTSNAVLVASNLAFLGMFVAIAIAVLKYRLYDIDLVISKAVLYACLAGFVTAVYVGLVAGVGTVVGGQSRPLLLAAAAAAVAVAFQPVRLRAERLANRVVYGRRATPYQVLSEFARRIGGAYASDEVLPHMARVVAAGTGAEQVVVWLRMGGELVPEASVGSAPGPAPAPLPVSDGGEVPPVPGGDVAVPVVHGGELLGAVSLRMPRGEALRPAGRQLVADVASQAGPVLANAGLVEDLRTSRLRLVTAQDEERRRLERDIHDGAQQDLVALAIKLGLVEEAVGDDSAREMLGQLRTDVAGALANLRDLARGIYPALLADHGLAAALRAPANRSPVPVMIEADRIGRFSQDAEAAVYFCCLEALQNTAKHSGAASARVCLQARGGTLRFTVSDDGVGYDTRTTPPGSGMRNMADRLAALGGGLEIRGAPGLGTTITGHVPAVLSRPGSA
jgi:signal transduction histidine kinase